jgi:hypothetical protein
MVPCIFGVLTVLNKAQAIARSTGASNEGLSWGRSAVEMGLHRMAALGMDKRGAQSGAEGATPFVTFRGPLPGAIPGGGGKGGAQAPPAKRIGF